MSLVIEDGTSVDNAVSYVTVAEVEAYCTSRNLSAWIDEDDDEVKEQAIMRAMDYIESLNFKGDKADFENTLEWPRIGWYPRGGNYGFLYTTSNYDAMIPTGLKYAVCRAAYEEINDPGCLQVTLEKSDFIKRQKIDVVETEYELNAPKAVYPAIEAHLKGLLRGNDAMVMRT